MAGKNQSHQFEDSIDVCAWLLTEITQQSDILKREQYDDPTTTINKLLLALRQVDYQASFPVQKLKTPHGELVVEILEYLTDKALQKKGFSWGKPNYNSLDAVSWLFYYHGSTIYSNLHVFDIYTVQPVGRQR